MVFHFPPVLYKLGLKLRQGGEFDAEYGFCNGFQVLERTFEMDGRMGVRERFARGERGGGG